MVGNATFTMEASITTRKMLAHTTPSTTHARRGTSGAPSRGRLTIASKRGRRTAEPESPRSGHDPRNATGGQNASA